MRSTNRIVYLLLVVFIISTVCGCNTTDNTPENTTETQSNVTEQAVSSETEQTVSYILPIPDSIVIGTSGTTKVVYPENEGFTAITALINGRFTESTGHLLMTISNSRKTGEDGNIISVADTIRSSETFAEFVYNDMQNDNLETTEPDSEESFTRVLFPLTGEYNSVFIIGTDEDYTVSGNNVSKVFGTLMQGTELIEEIDKLVSAN